jgi:hypothetical protein
MNNYGIRYHEYGLAWRPDKVSLDQYLTRDRIAGVYGNGDRQYVPKEYALEM